MYNLFQIAFGVGEKLPVGVATIIIAVIVAYFVGNISTATLIGRKKGIDIKAKGSGNAGTTNATRVLGKKAGAVVLLVDVLKGVLVVLAARLVGGEFLAMVCVIPVIVGHIWPIVFKFKGGKGVATTFGAVVSLSPAIGLCALAVVILSVAVSRRVSVGSVVGCIVLPFATWYFMPTFLVDSIVIALIVLFKHRSNIVRLIKGEEPKFTFGKDRS